EASIVASASYIAKIVREAGGFKAEATDRIMIGQVQVVGCPDFDQAIKEVESNKEMLIKAANDAYPSLVKRGGGAEDLDVLLLDEVDFYYNNTLIVLVFADSVEELGSNMINTMAEAIALVVEHLTRGKVYLIILSNYADRCLAKATCVIPPDLLASDGYT